LSGEIYLQNGSSPEVSFFRKFSCCEDSTPLNAKLPRLLNTKGALSSTRIFQPISACAKIRAAKTGL